MPPAQYRVELNLPPEEELFVLPRAGFVSSTVPMQLAAPTWTASYSTATSPRRPFTAADAPASPAGSSTSQKFEVKRLLSRPADLAPSSRPLTTFDMSSTPFAGPSSPPSSATTIKRSNSAGRGFLRRRSSKGHVDSTATPAPNQPRQRTTTAPALILQSQSPSYPQFLPPLKYDTPTRHGAHPYTPTSSISTSASASISSPPLSASSTSNLTPASAYALAYSQRTHMSALPETSKPRSKPPTRHPFEGAGGGRVVALGDPSDESLSLSLTSTIPALALAGFGPSPGESAPKDGLMRKASGKFKKRRVPDGLGIGVKSDAELEEGRKEWSREKERAGIRAVGLGLGPSPQAAVSRPMPADKSEASRIARNRLSRHLSIEDFLSFGRTDTGREKEKEGDKYQTRSRGDAERRMTDKTEWARARNRTESETRPTADAGKRGHTVGRAEGSRTRNDSHRSVSSRKDDAQRSSSRKDEPRRDTAVRSYSTPGQGSVESPSRPTGTISPENKTGGGILWRLVKKMSTGTLKEKRSPQPEKVPPVPRLPSTLPSSRRSSVADYGDEIRPELARFSRSSHSRPNTVHQATADIGASSTHSGPGSIHSGPSSFSGHHHHAHTHTHRIPIRPSFTGPNPTDWRPSMTNTNDSMLSSSPKSSFGRTQSPRTSMSSYVDVGDDAIPPLPLPLPVTGLVGKHIVAPGELAQYGAYPVLQVQDMSPSVAVAAAHREANASPSLPPPKRPRKPRDKPAPVAASPPTPTPTLTPSAPAPVAEQAKPKHKPNVLRRPTRLTTGTDEESVSGRLRSPRSASMGMPSPRSASISTHSPRSTQTTPPAQMHTRPRSSSMGTVFTFRELGRGGAEKKLSEQEKADKFEQLLEASDKAGGTLHARLQERLLSDTMRMSGTFGEGSSVSGL